MGVVTGKIVKIEGESEGVHLKNTVTLKCANSGYVAIEFRGVLKKVSDDFFPGENVIVEYAYNGRESKNSGMFYNNLPATSIKRIE